MPSDFNEITTKEIYLELLTDIEPPKVEDKYSHQDWKLTWERLNSGTLSQQSKSYLYLLIHDRVGTRERGH